MDGAGAAGRTGVVVVCGYGPVWKTWPGRARGLRGRGPQPPDAFSNVGRIQGVAGPCVIYGLSLVDPRCLGFSHAHSGT